MTEEIDFQYTDNFDETIAASIRAMLGLDGKQPLLKIGETEQKRLANILWKHGMITEEEVEGLGKISGQENERTR